MNNETTNTPSDATGLSEGYRNAPATFPVTLSSGHIVDGSSTISKLVTAANEQAAIITQTADTVRNAARAHLLATLNLGYILERMSTEAAACGIAVASLYSDWSGNQSVRSRAMSITGGQTLPFTSRTGRNYRKVYAEVKKRMLAGGVSQADANRMLVAHIGCVIGGEYEDPTAADERIWGRWLTTDNLRQTYLELAPALPQPTLGEVLDRAESQSDTGIPSWDERRAKICTQFGTYYATLETYLEKYAMNISSADREEQADRLEAIARRLRATKTQPDLPGIVPAAAAK